MKRCVLCKRFTFEEGSPHYSELTPGSDAHISCDSDIFKSTSLTDVSEREFFAILRTAEGCDSYEIDPAR